MSDYPIIWYIFDADNNLLGKSIQLTKEEAEKDANGRFSGKWKAIVDSSLKKPPNACCNKCGDKPCS